MSFGRSSSVLRSWMQPWHCLMRRKLRTLLNSGYLRSHSFCATEHLASTRREPRDRSRGPPLFERSSVRWRNVVVAVEDVLWVVLLLDPGQPCPVLLAVRLAVP